MKQYPRAVWRGQTAGSRALGGAGAALALALLSGPAVAGPKAAPPPGRILRIEIGARWLRVPTGRWSLEQRSLGAGVALQPLAWLELESAIEVSATEILARRLRADPYEVRTRLDARRSWGLAHALAIRTHSFPPGRLVAFGELRWMPGTAALRILELIVGPGALDLDLSDFGRLDGLARARFAWWQAALGARLGCRLGPLDTWLDAGALWSRVALSWSLGGRALALGRLAAASDEPIDPDGRWVIEKEKPFARLGLRLALPASLALTGSGIAVPTGRGIAHGLGFSASWSP